MNRTELYVGNLNRDIRQHEIQSLFERYGKIKNVEIKNKGHGPVYAFIEFEDERDAQFALNAEHGKEFFGASMIVEYSKGGKYKYERRDYRYSSYPSPPSSYSRNFYNDRRFTNSSIESSSGLCRSIDCKECNERYYYARMYRNDRSESNRGQSEREIRRQYRSDRERDRYSDYKRREKSRSRSRTRSRSRSYDRRRSYQYIKYE